MRINSPASTLHGRCERLIKRPLSLSHKLYRQAFVVALVVMPEMPLLRPTSLPRLLTMWLRIPTLSTLQISMRWPLMFFMLKGGSLDRFLLGRLGLRPSVSNRIGTFFDPTGNDYRDDVIHVLNAAKAVAGISCDDLIRLDKPLGARIEWAPSGSASGLIDDPETLLLGVEKLLDAGCEAVGGVSVIHGVTQEMCRLHVRGELPNPSGVIEAIITHLISKIFNVPCAHAPLPYYQSVKDKCIDNPRASAESISTPHYFCVLKGLAKAPQLVAIDNLDYPPLDAVTVNSLAAIVAPATALGGIPALAAEYHDIPLIAVNDNVTILGMTQQQMEFSNVIQVDSYLEAAGVVLAIRNGISIDSLRRPISRARFIN